MSGSSKIWISNQDSPKEDVGNFEKCISKRIISSRHGIQVLRKIELSISSLEPHYTLALESWQDSVNSTSYNLLV